MTSIASVGEPAGSASGSMIRAEVQPVALAGLVQDLVEQRDVAQRRVDAVEEVEERRVPGDDVQRKFNLPVELPLHIIARNSALFYLFDRIHPTLRDITLFHEVLNKTRQRYRLNLGPHRPRGAAARLDEAIEVSAPAPRLGGRKPQSVLTAPVYGRPGRLKPARLMG